MHTWIDGQNVLVTGGTGSFGRKFVEIVLKEHQPKRLIVFSRDELKQHEMRASLETLPQHEVIRYFIGDVRDPERLRRACRGVNVIVHAAALKQVPACEYNPFEAVQTNVVGAKNVIDAAIEESVDRVLALSTDKAVSPVNLYGATKLCAEKLFVQGNVYSRGNCPKFSCIRYGNVVGSRGSVVSVFKRQQERGVLTITDPAMTRFWITLEQGVRFVLASLGRMQGGEIFVPKLPSMKVVDLAHAVAPNADFKVVGIRPGEKVHELLLTEEESRHTREFGDHYVIEPQFPYWNGQHLCDGDDVSSGFRYSSGENTQWLNTEELHRMIEGV